MTLLITVFAAVIATVVWYTRKDDSMKLGNTSVCKIYDVKPGKVLLGGDCDEYSKEE